jgi:hypothetical protein
MIGWWRLTFAGYIIRLNCNLKEKLRLLYDLFTKRLIKTLRNYLLSSSIMTIFILSKKFSASSIIKLVSF